MAEGPKRAFDDITARLDEIVATVRSKDTSLERSLDLFDEAIELGSQAVDMVDSFELSPREAELLDEREAAANAAAKAPAEGLDAESGKKPEEPAGPAAPHGDGREG